LIIVSSRKVAVRDLCVFGEEEEEKFLLNLKAKMFLQNGKE
jgi:hypothetical protein